MSRFAWVTLVMLGDRYVQGALVLAHSLRLTKTKADIVVLVTPDVTAVARVALAQIFTSVIEVPYLEGTFNHHLTSKQQFRYGKFMSKLPTKFHALNLTQYDKIMLMDADAIVQSNADDLFDLAAPAGVWEFYPEIAKNTTAGRALVGLKHGDKVPEKLVDLAFEQTFVCWGTSLLLEPSKADFEAVVKMAKAGFGKMRCPSGFEEQVLASYYKNKWTKISSRYSLVPWKNWGDETTAVILHFYSDKKPWEYPLSEENVWEDIKIWRRYYLSYLAEARGVDMVTYEKTDIADVTVDELPNCRRTT